MTLGSRSHTLAVLTALLLAGCASQGPSLTTSSLKPEATAPGLAAQPAQTVSRLPSEAGYRLSDTERNLDCRTLTGRMAVRIVQLRDYHNRVQATAVSRGIQSTVSPVFGGGSSAGLDPEGRYARDRAQLAAYNELLAAKDCANFDIEAELNPAAKGPPRTREPKRT